MNISRIAPSGEILISFCVLPPLGDTQQKIPIGKKPSGEVINGGHVINQWSMRKFTAWDLSRTWRAGWKPRWHHQPGDGWNLGFHTHGIFTIWMFPKIVGFPPKSSHFNRVFHYKPSILGFPYLETPISTGFFRISGCHQRKVWTASRVFCFWCFPL